MIVLDEKAQEMLNEYRLAVEESDRALVKAITDDGTDGMKKRKKSRWHWENETRIAKRLSAYLLSSKTEGGGK